jgi:hypothetical protein
MELSEITIFYFNKEKLLQDLSGWSKNKETLIPPIDQSYWHYFDPKTEKHKILDVIEYENKCKFLVLEKDIIWEEALPAYDTENRKLFFDNKNTDRFLSIRSCRERDSLFKELVVKNKNNYKSPTDSLFVDIYKLMDRNDKLEKLGI